MAGKPAKNFQSPGKPEIWNLGCFPMTEEPRIKRSRLVVDLPEEDRAWVRAQSEATGWNSEALVVRMLIKDAREKGLSFAVVAAAPGAPLMRVAPRTMLPVPSHMAWRSETADAEEIPTPVDPAEVESLLAERLGEAGIDAATVATEPWPEMAGVSPVGGAPLAVNGGVAISLAPAPPRAARDYR
jgi:hypothetical protein